ncbi:MAG: DUF5683 domain-containing protein [Prevotella sp.]
MTLMVLVMVSVVGASAQDTYTETDSLFIAEPLEIPELNSDDSISIMPDTLPAKRKRDWNTWRPDAKRAMWLAIVLPGAGQIYNRKYWKLPLVYGGITGCIYAITWNNQMFHDYSQAYMDIMDNDPNTDSYNDFLHLGNVVDESNKSRYQELFRKRKDRYRRWRDLSVFALIGVYALSVIDAYVDASLSEFDISDDLSLSVSPTVIDARSTGGVSKSPAIGVGCSLRF